MGGARWGYGTAGADGANAEVGGANGAADADADETASLPWTSEALPAAAAAASGAAAAVVGFRHCLISPDSPFKQPLDSPVAASNSNSNTHSFPAVTAKEASARSNQAVCQAKGDNDEGLRETWDEEDG